MREGLPKPVAWAATALFVLSVLSTIGAIIYFVSRPTSAAERINPGFSDVVMTLRVATVLLGGICASSLALAVHFRRRGAYRTTEEIFFFACFGISLCLGLLTGIPAVAAFFV